MNWLGFNLAAVRRGLFVGSAIGVGTFLAWWMLGGAL